MIEVTAHPNNLFKIRLDDASMTSLMAIVAGAGQPEIQSVSDLIRYEFDYMIERFYTAIGEPPTDGQ